jgi:hypothetical protein
MVTDHSKLIMQEFERGGAGYLGEYKTLIIKSDFYVTLVESQYKMSCICIPVREFQRRSYISDFVRHGKIIYECRSPRMDQIREHNETKQTSKFTTINAKLLPQMSTRVRSPISAQNQPTCYIYLLFGILSCLQYAGPPDVTPLSPIPYFWVRLTQCLLSQLKNMYCL